MYLKSIEVHGFKSFANKITFKFHNGITGIVGPNGSGKSNVADAVRWVLGEQSAKQLRGASMQDVIFSGTELRKPMGYAYVSITLDNSDHKLPTDYEEVTVSRRVYRSGESEYLINGSICRLKDVYEMFYDTGIGKEGYSIIGQGQIDKILSGKPEERRELFDEAAGIVKFKRRKITSVKKLESEKQNLVRVSDILSELEKQTGPLEKQSEVAKEYLKKREILKTLDVNLFLLDAIRIKNQLDEYDEKLKISENDLAEAKKQYEQLKNDYNDIDSEIAKLDAEIEQKREKIAQSGVYKEKLEGEIKLNEEKINSSNNNIKLYSDQKNSLDERFAKQAGELKRFKDSKSDIDNKLEELVTKRNEAKNKLEELQGKINELNIKIQNDNDEVINIVKDRATVQETLGRYETMLEQAKIKKADIQSKLIRTKSDEAEQEENIKKLKEELEAVESKLRGCDEKLAEKEKVLGNFKVRLEEEDNKLQEAQMDYHVRKARLDTLRNIAERYDGYGGSIKTVMEQKDRNKGIIGVVADILKVEKKYETAIEIALGGNIQNVITENDEVAKKMIQLLKETKSGRVTFMPLTSVKKRDEYARPEVRQEKGFIGLASELVSADDKYSDVISQLLGAILVVDKYDNALAMEKKFDRLLRIVTLDGEYFTPGGSVAGGTFKNASNLLGRKREIESLETEIKNAKAKIDGILDSIEQIKDERKKVREEIEVIRDEQQDISILQNTAKMNVDVAVKRKEENKLGYQELEISNADVDREVSDIHLNQDDTREKLNASVLREKQLNEEIASFGKELEKLRDEETRFVMESTDLDMQYNTLARDADHSSRDVQRVEEEINRIQVEIDEVKGKIAEEEKSIQGYKDNIAAINETISASIEQKDFSKEDIDASVLRKEELIKKRTGFFSLSEEVSNKISGLDKEVYRINSQHERLEEEQEKQINYMWSEYEITLSQASSLRDETLDNPTVIRRDIGQIKDEIKRLGNVNVNAIEEYRTLMERYDFLKQQHDDLVKAQEDLEKIIADLDEAMRKQFTEKFKEISSEFDKVFKEMFGGGKGTLEIDQDEDILEAGIRIIAQPPGKKLQNMMQLSGGEKALTAIALLFAIQNLKPSPFCLLDEIEAALDESNVGRFAGYLHKLTKHTQFIVITHRRGTMEKADRLYGITMQEKGVSALVSVSLIDKDLED